MALRRVIGRGRRSGRAGLLAASIIVVGAMTSLAVNWPGHFSYDSIVQLSEGRNGDYTGGHPPVMSWLLGVADAITPGAVAFVVLQTALIAGALVSLIALGRKTAWPIAPITLVLAAIPQLLIFPAIVWKDVLFAASSVAGFVCLANAGVAWRRRRVRWFLLLALAVPLLVVATLTRQNGLLVLPFAAIAVGWIATLQDDDRRAWTGVVYGIGYLLTTSAVALAVALALSTREDVGFAISRPGASLQVYDIVNALLLAPDAPLPVLHAKAPKMDHILRTDGVARYSPIRADTLDPVIGELAASGEPAGLIDEQWTDLILHQPLLYLEARARTFAWVFFTPDHTRCVLVYTGVDGPDEEMADSGLHYRRTPWDKALARYALSFSPTPVYSHAAYAGAGLVILGLLLMRRRPPDLAVAAMIAAALAFAVSFAVISIACDYRYLYALDLTVVAAIVYAAATWNGIAHDAASGPLGSTAGWRRRFRHQQFTA